jgi:hypothetical protein
MPTYRVKLKSHDDTIRIEADANPTLGVRTRAPSNYFDLQAGR